MIRPLHKTRFIERGYRLHEIGELKRHRHAIVLCGDMDWGWRSAQDLCEPFTKPDKQNILLVSDPDYSPLSPTEIHQSVRINQCRNHLGREYDAVIHDCHSGFEADAIGIVAATVKAGGLLILLAPALTHWPKIRDYLFEKRIPHGLSPPRHSRYIERLVRRIQSSEHCILIEQGCGLPSLPELPRSRCGQTHPDYRDQTQAVNAVKKVVTGQRRHPVVLLADRGRGKSAALGLAARALLDSGRVHRIGVCGLNRKSVENVFKHARIDSGAKDTALKFIPADRLIREKADIEMLLIDEAATLPIPVLTEILKTYPRIAFASTVHGYEGTGRGFATHFGKLLDQYTRGWKKCELRHPIRWAEQDPVEKLLFDILLLDAESAPVPGEKHSASNINITAIDKNQLVACESRLREVFALLTQAHYRTRPGDLRYLLDSPNLDIYCAGFQGQVSGVALVSVEGGLSETQAREVWGNHSRPVGHLFAELLAAQAGLHEGAQQTTARIVRIVVKPEYQRSGIGSALIREIASQYKALDSLSASFGASAPFIRFWGKNLFLPVRIGFKPGANTGALSCAMMRPLSRRGEQLAYRAQNKFRGNLPLHLKTRYRDMEPKLMIEIYNSLSRQNNRYIPPQDELIDLIGFGFAHRNMDNISSALSGFCQYLLTTEDNDLSETDAALLIERILQSKPWRQCNSLAPPRGKKQGKARLRAIIQAGLLHHLPTQTRHICQAYGLFRTPTSATSRLSKSATTNPPPTIKAHPTNDMASGQSPQSR